MPPTQLLQGGDNKNKDHNKNPPWILNMKTSGFHNKILVLKSTTKMARILGFEHEDFFFIHLIIPIPSDGTKNKLHIFA